MRNGFEIVDHVPLSDFQFLPYGSQQPFAVKIHAQTLQDNTTVKQLSMKYPHFYPKANETKHGSKGIQLVVVAIYAKSQSLPASTFVYTLMEIPYLEKMLKTETAKNHLGRWIPYQKHSNSHPNV